MDIIVTLWHMATDDADTDVIIATSAFSCSNKSEDPVQFFCVHLRSLWRGGLNYLSVKQ